jgi:anti-anti-sigma regulatory factor
MADTLRSTVVDRTAPDARHRNNGAAAFGRSDHVTVGYGTSLQMRIVRGEGRPVALVLHGELDITSMPPFEEALAEVMAQHPSQLLIDLTECRFVSAQGYAAMGRCSASTSIEVRSRTDIARRVFTILGYDRVVSTAP